ncbi:MAG: hypothetical protein AAFU56_02620, partial [Pseudomonadota bacterium]
MRQAFSGQYGYGPFTPHAGAAAVESDRLANIKRAIEAIEQRLHGASLQPTAQAAYSAAYGLGGASPLARGGGGTPGAGDTASPLTMLQQQLARLSSQVAQSGSSATAQPSLSDAQEIVRRQAELNAAASAASVEQPTGSATDKAQIQQTPNSDNNAALAAVARHLKDLRKDLNGLKQDVAKPAQPAQVGQSDIDRIATTLAELQAQKPVDSQNPQTEQKLDGLTSELNALRATLERDLSAARQTDVDAIADRDQELQQRLDALSNGLDTLAQHAAATMTPQVENLGNRLDELRTSVEDMPQTLAIS